jgi:predicted transposase YdaD
MLKVEDVMESSIYQMGKQRGEQEGELKGELKTLARLYERRLQRPLTEGERTAVAQRLEKLGVDRLLDVPQELSSDALAAWLDDPAGNGS